MCTPLTESFDEVVRCISSEAKTLRCLSNLRGITAHISEEASTAIEDIAAMVTRLEQRLTDTEAFIDNEISCLDLLNDLNDKSLQQQHTVHGLTRHA